MTRHQAVGAARNPELVELHVGDHVEYAGWLGTVAEVHDVVNSHETGWTYTVRVDWKTQPILEPNVLSWLVRPRRFFPDGMGLKKV